MTTEKNCTSQTRFGDLNTEAYSDAILVDGFLFVQVARHRVDFLKPLSIQVRHIEEENHPERFE